MSRRKKRYINRQKHRIEKRNAFLRDFDRFENVCSFSALYRAAEEAANGVRWKASVQRYLLNNVINSVRAGNDLRRRKNPCKGFICFDICERGKLRHIRSVHFSERVIQKSLCKNALYPILTHNLIYDNGASQKYKGTAFALSRLQKHLEQHYRKFGNSGFVLLIDFKSYFDNINHEVLKKYYRKYIKDENLLWLTDLFVDAFGKKGLGLGSETSQIHAIAYPNEIDHFIKDQCGVKAYGRYMDDSYIISDSKEYLEQILTQLRRKFEQLHITVSPKKTHITDLRHGFCFLKTRFFLTDSGKIIKKPCRKSVTAERRRIKKQSKLIDAGIMSADEAMISFVSWRGSMKGRHAAKTIYNMVKLLRKVLKI